MYIFYSGLHAVNQSFDHTKEEFLQVIKKIIQSDNQMSFYLDSDLKLEELVAAVGGILYRYHHEEHSYVPDVKCELMKLCMDNTEFDSYLESNRLLEWKERHKKRRLTILNCCCC